MKLFSACLTFLLITLTGNAQNFRINLFGGIANYQGDLQDKRFTFSQAKGAFGAGVSYDLSSKLVLRSGLTFAKITADDKLSSRNKARNLNFSSAITEGHIALEYYLKDLSESALSPYVFAGIAVYHFNPYTFDSTGNKVFLKSLSTEGQGFVTGRNPYNLTQISIPFGAGIKLALSDDIHVGVEVGLRKLFTDYLDDVSTNYVDQAQLLANRGQQAVSLAYRGNELKNGSPYPPAGNPRGGAKYKDWYYFSGINMSFRLGSNHSSHYGSRSGIGCPASLN